jgi:hypothetical protein
MESSISPNFHQARFRGEWFPDGAEPIDGYSDGGTAGGWENPVFTRQVLLAAIKDGLLGDPAFGASRCFFDDDRDACVLVSSVDGERLPDDLDVGAVLALASDVVDDVHVDGRDYRVEVGAGFDVQVNGGVVRVYSVGNGLIWSLSKD